MNIPNLLTLLRFLLIPVLGYFFYKQQYVTSVVLMLLCGLTDLLDGYIARRFKTVTDFGKIADPLADKLLEITVLALLTTKFQIPFAILLFFIVKEFLIIIGGTLIYKKCNIIVSSDRYGKISTLIFYIAVLAVILKIPHSYSFIIAAIITNAFTLFVYFLKYKKYIVHQYSKNNSKQEESF